MYKVSWKYKPLLCAIDCIGSILFFWTKLKHFPKQVGKILVIRLDHIGDMVMTTPIFRQLKQNYPDAEIHVLCRSQAKPVIDNLPTVDKIIEFSPAWFLRREAEPWSKRIATIKQLRHEKYNLVFEPHSDPRNIILAWLIGGYRVSYGIRGFGFLLNKAAKYAAGIKHNVERNLDLLRAIGCKIEKPRLELKVDKTAEKTVLALLKKLKISKKDFIIALHPITGRLEKNLGSEEVEEICGRELKKRKNAKILILGTKQDIEKIKLPQNKNIYNLMGALDLKQYVALISNADRVICADTLAVHVAAAFNKQLETVFKTTDEREWGAYLGGY